MISLALILFTFLLTTVPVRFIGLWKQQGMRWLGIWAVLTTLAFLCGHFLVFALVIWIACAYLRKEMPGRAATIYVLLLPLIPTYHYFLSGIPGINVLFSLDYTRVLALFLLLPAYISARSVQRGQPVRHNAVDVFFVLYCMWWMFVVVANHITVTDVLRQLFEILFFTLVPYLAVRRLLRTRDDVHDLLRVLVFTGVVVSCVCVMEIVFNRTFYTDLPTRLHTAQLSGLAYIKQFRFGLLRVRGTMDGGLAVFSVFAMTAALCLAKMEKIPRSRLWTIIGLLAVPIIFSGSRGTWIMTGMVIAIWAGFAVIRTPLRFLVVMLVVYTASPAIQAYLLSTNDQFGTFSYRQRLLETFLPVIPERPWFGWNTLGALYSTGRFNSLVQGESIIDMVNTFLGEALLRGVPGFLFFSGIFLFSVIVPLRRLQRLSPREAELEYPMVKLVCSFMPAVAFLLITTSVTGHTWVYISLAAAVAGALGSMEPAQSIAATQPRRTGLSSSRAAVGR